MVWDIVVIGLFVAQVVALGTVVYFGWRIYKEPVGRLTPRLQEVAKSAYRTGVVINKNYEGKEARVVALAQKAIQTYEDANKSVTIPDMPITYRSLFGGLATFRMATGLLSSARKMFQPKPPPGPAAAKPSRRSLAHQMGFVPPVVDRVGSVAPFLRAAYGAWRELRRRGIL